MKKQFIFTSYDFNPDQKTLQLHYRFDDEPEFTETYSFDFPYINYNKAAVDKACQALHIMAGVSYFKTYLAEEIILKNTRLSSDEASFFEETYQKGLGEFFYVNKLSPKTPMQFPVDNPHSERIRFKNDGLLIGIGGGKDSLLSVELLKSLPRVATWSVGHRQQLEPLIQRIGIPHFWVERTIDPQLIKLNSQPDTLNGHVPISAILSCVGVIVALLTGYQDIVVSNENSSNEPTLIYKNTEINHQYSKSLEYEQAFQGYVSQSFGESVRYYSFLRPLSEVYIAELFARTGFDKYKDVFCSCNRAFRQDEHTLFWCGKCAKCAFTFMAFTPFVAKNNLESLWHKNLLEDPTLIPTYRKLLGIDADKPLDCVGEVKESRQAMQLAFKEYPNLQKTYHFEIPSEYHYKNLAPHNMPEDIATVLFTALDELEPEKRG